jgi:hypothetical protein
MRVFLFFQLLVASKRRALSEPLLFSGHHARGKAKPLTELRFLGARPLGPGAEKFADFPSRRSPGVGSHPRLSSLTCDA